MESMKSVTNDPNPANALAKTNEEISKVVLAAKQKNNQAMEEMIAEKERDLAQKRAFLQENARFLQ